MTTIPFEIYLFFKHRYPEISDKTEYVEFHPHQFDTEIQYVLPSKFSWYDLEATSPADDIKKAMIFKFTSHCVAYAPEIDTLYIGKR